MELRRILCAVDFSECSRAALETASALAIRWHATLVLVHVDELPLWVDEPYFHLPGDVRTNLAASTEARLAEWQEDARRIGAKQVETRLETGVPWERIVAAAREDRAIDLVVVGTHGRTGLRRAMIGSVAERVARYAPCDVLIVRPRD